MKELLHWFHHIIYDVIRVIVKGINDMYSARNTYSEYDVIRVIVKGINDMYSARNTYSEYDDCTYHLYLWQ
jgi:hypothetical protein